MIQFKWYSSPRPSGRWRSFETRAWPFVAHDGKDGPVLAYLHCKDGESYTARRAKDEAHGELTLYIRFGNPRELWPSKGAFTYKALNIHPANVREAMLLFKTFVERTPDHEWGIAAQQIDASQPKGTV